MVCSMYWSGNTGLCCLLISPFAYPLLEPSGRFHENGSNQQSIKGYGVITFGKHKKVCVWMNVWVCGWVDSIFLGGEGVGSHESNACTISTLLLLMWLTHLRMMFTWSYFPSAHPSPSPHPPPPLLISPCSSLALPKSTPHRRRFCVCQMEPAGAIPSHL